MFREGKRPLVSCTTPKLRAKVINLGKKTLLSREVIGLVRLESFCGRPMRRIELSSAGLRERQL